MKSRAQREVRIASRGQETVSVVSQGDRFKCISCVPRLKRKCIRCIERYGCTKCPTIGRFLQFCCTLLYTQLHAHIQNCCMISTTQLLCKDVTKSCRTVLVKRNLLTLDVKFLHHLQSTPFLQEYSGTSVSTMLGSIPGSPFLELCQVPDAIPLESLQWCRIFDPSSEASN